jgi:hypothetical protein
VQYARKTPADTRGNPWVFDHPFFMIMNVAVGGAWPGDPTAATVMPQTMMIDYVRVYAYTTSPTTPPAGGAVQVRNAQGRCLDVPGGVATENVQLQIFDCNGSAAQRWTFAADGSVQSLGKCLNLSGGATANGTAIVLSTCNNSAAQKFRINAVDDLVSGLATKCVNVNGANANLTKLNLQPCNGAAAQTWTKVA